MANTLLWHANVRRLDAESLRDAMLHVAGELALTPPEGSVISSFKDREFNNRIHPSVDQLSSLHRSVYLPMARYWVPDMLSEFDLADPSLVVGKRTERTMASQSLFLMNSQFVFDRAKQISAKIASQPEADRAALAFRRILLRDPTVDEATQLTVLVKELGEGTTTDTSKSAGGTANAALTESLKKSVGENLTAAWQSACQTLLMAAEFRYVR
jgi:hypothetical protein